MNQSFNKKIYVIAMGAVLILKFLPYTGLIMSICLGLKTAKEKYKR